VQKNDDTAENEEEWWHHGAVGGSGTRPNYLSVKLVMANLAIAPLT
jgi:hypothetical protein